MVFGIPRSGKTWLATKWALAAMERGRKTVFTNYPVYHPKLGPTKRWTRDMVNEVIVDSVIIIDEAYRDYDYRNKTGFSPNEDFFYGTSGQNGNDIYLIAHSPVRVDPKIRDRAEIYHKISKTTLPIVSFITYILFDREIILWFNDELYMTEEDVSNPEKAYATNHTIYRRKVSRAYDTRYFRTKDPMRTDFPTWPAPNVPPRRHVRELPARALHWLAAVRARIRTARKAARLGPVSAAYAKSDTELNCSTSDHQLADGEREHELAEDPCNAQNE